MIVPKSSVPIDRCCKAIDPLLLMLGKTSHALIEAYHSSLSLKAYIYCHYVYERQQLHHPSRLRVALGRSHAAEHKVWLPMQAGRPGSTVDIVYTSS